MIQGNISINTTKQTVEREAQGQEKSTKIIIAIKTWTEIPKNIFSDNKVLIVDNDLIETGKSTNSTKDKNNKIQ